MLLFDVGTLLVGASEEAAAIDFDIVQRRYVLYLLDCVDWKRRDRVYHCMDTM